MANVSVTYQDLRDVATKLASGQEDLESKLAELKALVDGLVGAGFVTDKASGAFSTAYEEFTTGLKGAVGGLTDMKTFLDKAAEAYEQADSELASAFGG